MGRPKPRIPKSRRKNALVEMRKYRWPNRSSEKGEREGRPVSQYIGDHTLEYDF